ncbi:MAG: hypothetical protein U0168_15490 [Nannocystaceae bacterium]
MAVVPTARPLQQVAAQGRGVADARRRGRTRGLAHGPERRAEVAEVGQLRQGHQRADVPRAALLDDAAHALALVAAERPQLDQLVGGVEAFLEVIDEVDAAGAEAPGLRRRGHALRSLGRGRQTHEGEAMHGRQAPVGGTRPSAASTFAGVMGRLRTGTPSAS